MRTAPGRIENRVSWIILAVLAVTAAGIFRAQFSFNPAVLTARELAKNQLHPELAAPSAGWLPPEIKTLGAPESFTPDSLSDKIDGKAELYLAAGFVALHCQRFALKNAPDEWLEWFAYDMGTFPHAFSVFSTQRRSEGEALAVARFAYRADNSLYFVCGSNYVEAVGCSTNAALMGAAVEMARQYVAHTPANTLRLPELEILPLDGLDSGSYTLETSDAFGFDKFKNVFTAQYNRGGARLVAFVTSCADPSEARSLCDAYRAFLMANGGRESAGAVGTFGRPIEIMGTVEIVFSEGRFVAGVHSAPSIAPAEQLATRLHEGVANAAAAKPDGGLN